MLRLRTFGSVFVADATSRPLVGAAGQRRVLAFLSVVAAAGEGGLSRDKLAALLWPEANADRARHSVTQALYAARRALGVDDLFIIAGGDVRLNRERLASDVEEMDAALARGDLERCAELYQGPFLDGFYLPGSSEFEQWSSMQRARYEDRVVAAIERLASQSEESGDLRGAVERRKRLAEIRPLDGAITVRLMTTLAQTGDRAGAIRQAQVHEALLHEQLELEPDPVVTALATRLREPVTWRDDAARIDGAGASSDASAERAESPVATVETLSRPPEPRDTPVLVRVEHSRVRRRPRRVLAIALVALVALTTWGVVMRQRAPAGAPVSVPLRERVVVAPFRVAGASEALSYLREGLVELLSTRLADDSASRSVDAGAVLRAWRAAGLAGNVDVPRDTVVGLAAGLGAERVVIGNVVGTRTHVVINASVIAVPSGAPLGEGTVEGPADSILTLVDRLAARLLLQEAGEMNADGAIADQTTASLPALRAFLAGQAAFRRAEFAVARRAYERALRLDSSFALAALQLVRADDRLQVHAGRSAALALAWSGRDALGEQERAALTALTGPRYPAPSSADEQLAAWQRLVELAPDRAESWYELGLRFLHDGAVLGRSDWPRRAVSAFQRALSIDSGYAPARVALVQVAARSPSIAGFVPGDSTLRAASLGPLAPFARWRAAVAHGDARALDRIRDTLPRLGRANLRAIAQASQFDAGALDDGRRALRELHGRTTQLADRVDLAEAEHSLALNEGRQRDAVDAAGRLDDLRPGSDAALRLAVLDALYGDGDQRAAEAAIPDLVRTTLQPLSTQRTVRVRQTADGCVLAQWRLGHGDTTDVRRLADLLRAEPANGVVESVAVTPPWVCAGLVEAALAVQLGRPDAFRLLARIDSLALSPAVVGDAAAYAPLLLARLHERLGDVSGALAATRRRSYMVGWPRYLATTLRAEGRYAGLLGATEVAHSAYERFLALRAQADSALAPDVQAVRRAVTSLVPPS